MMTKVEPGPGSMDGFEELTPSDTLTYTNARLLLELGNSKVNEAEARVDAFSNGLEAAKLKRDMEVLDLREARAKVIRIEMSMGITQPSDIVTKDGKIFRRIKNTGAAGASAEPQKPETAAPPAAG